MPGHAWTAFFLLHFYLDIYLDSTWTYLDGRPGFRASYRRPVFEQVGAVRVEPDALVRPLALRSVLRPDGAHAGLGRVQVPAKPFLRAGVPAVLGGAPLLPS